MCKMVLLFFLFLSRLELAEAKHKLYFSYAGSGVNFFPVFALILLCEKVLTGKTLHSVEFLLTFTTSLIQ